MEGHVKICITAVKVHCKPLQEEQYKKRERKLISVAREIDKKGNSSSEIHTVFFSYEKYLREKFFQKFECVERDKTYQKSRKYLTPQPLPGAANDESGSVAEAVNHGEPDRQQNTEAQQPNSDARKNILAKMNGKKDVEGSKNSAPQPSAKDKKSPLAEDVKQGQPTRQQNTLEELLKLKRAVFKPNKGEEEVHSTEDTVKRVSELQSQEELTKLKQAVFTPNKGKDVVHSTEDAVKRVAELQRSETELLELKKITFDEELMNAAFGGKQNEYKHTVESARALMQNLKGLFRNTQAEREKLRVAIMDKNDPCSVEDALKALDSLKRTHVELQQLLGAFRDSENPFTTDTAMKKVQQLKRSVRENQETIQQQKAECDRLEKNASEMEKRYNSLMREKEDLASRMDSEMKRLQRERDDLLKRFSEVAGAKMADGNPNQ